MSDLIVSEIYIYSNKEFVSLAFKANIRDFYFNFGDYYYIDKCTAYQKHFINECLNRIRKSTQKELIEEFGEDRINFDYVNAKLNEIPLLSEIQYVRFTDLVKNYPVIK